MIPNPPGAVIIVNGAYRGCEAKVDQIEIEEYRVQVTVTSGVYKGKTMKIDYEDLSKLDICYGETEVSPTTALPIDDSMYDMLFGR